MLLVRLFSKQDFATYRQTILIYTMAAPLLGMGLAQSVMYFLPTAERKERGGLILEAVIPLLFAGIVYYLAILLGGNYLIAQVWDNPRLAQTLLIMAPVGVFMLANQCLAPSLIATNHVTLAALFGVVSGISLAVATAITTWFLPEIEVALATQIVVHLILFVVAAGIFRKNFSMRLPKLSGSRKQLEYGIPLGLSSAVAILSRSVDRAMVSTYCKLEQFAEFDRGAMELPLVNVVTGSMNSILLVDYRVMLEDGRVDEILPLLHRAIKKSAAILLPAMFFLLCLAPEFMVCLYGQEYKASYPVFQIYLLLLPCRTLVFSSIALAAGKTRELAIVPIVTIIANIILNYLAIQMFGHIGCAMATVFVVYFVSAYGRALIAQRILNCSLSEFIPWAMFGKISVLSLIPLIPVVAFLGLSNIQNEWLRLIGSFIIYSTFLMPLFWRFGYVDPNAIAARIKRFFPNNI